MYLNTGGMSGQGRFPLIPERIPAELRNFPQWILWREEEREGKPTKVPINPHNGRRASPTDPQTWGTFSESLAALTRWRADGLGFVLGGEDPFVGIDLDRCVEGGRVSSEAQRIIQRLNSYTEISPSGKGVHILLKGRKRTPNCRRGWLECYDANRFLTVTGLHLPGTPRTIEERQEALDWFLKEYLDDRNGAEQQSLAPQEGLSIPVAEDDQQLLERIQASKQGEKFDRLWRGEWEGEYPSESEADLALATILLFWTGGDWARTLRLLRRSALWDTKWEREDYQERTLRKAQEGLGVRGLSISKGQVGTMDTQEPKSGGIKDLWKDVLPGEYPELRWVVPEILPEGLAIFAGRQKTGKSLLALDLALAVACGGYALGSRDFPCEKGDVLYLALEDSERRVRERALRILGEGRVSDPAHFGILTEIPRLDRGGIKILKSWLADRRNPKLIVVDVWSRLAPRSRAGMPSYEEEYHQAGTLQRLALEHGVAILLIHHTSKMRRDYVFDEILGTTAMGGSPDTLWVLRREDARRSRLHITGRDVAQRELVVEFDPSSLLWRVVGDAEEVEMGDLKKDILELLEEEGPLSPLEIAKKLGRPPSSVKSALLRLAELGRVRKRGRGRSTRYELG